MAAALASLTDMAEGGLSVRHVSYATLWASVACAVVLGLSLLSGGCGALSGLAQFVVMGVSGCVAWAHWRVHEEYRHMASVARDLQRVGCLDVNVVETDADELSLFADVRELQLGILSVASGLRECKPYFPETVVKELERTCMVLGQVPAAEVMDDSTETVEAKAAFDLMTEEESNAAANSSFGAMLPLATLATRMSSRNLRARQVSLGGHDFGESGGDRNSSGDQIEPDYGSSLLHRRRKASTLLVGISDGETSPSERDKTSPPFIPTGQPLCPPTHPLSDSPTTTPDNAALSESTRLPALDGSFRLVSKRQGLKRMTQNTTRPPAIPEGARRERRCSLNEAIAGIPRRGSRLSLRPGPPAVVQAQLTPPSIDSGAMSPHHQLCQLRNFAAFQSSSGVASPASASTRSRQAMTAASQPPTAARLRGTPPSGKLPQAPEDTSLGKLGEFRLSGAASPSKRQQQSDAAATAAAAAAAAATAPTTKRVGMPNVDSPTTVPKGASSKGPKTPRYPLRRDMSFQARTSVASGARTPSLFSSLQLCMRKKRGTVLSAVFDVAEVAMHDLTGTYEVCNSLVCVVLDIVKEQYGKVCEFGANQVLCSWNTHSPCTRHALTACRAALEIRNAIMADPDSFGGEGGESDRGVSSPTSTPQAGPQSVTSAVPGEEGLWSIAVATGNVFCGNVGNDSQRSPFVFGDVLDQAQMLNRLSLQLNAPVLLADSTKSALHDTRLKMRPLDMVDWGFLGPCESQREAIHELLREDTPDVERWKEGFHAFLCSDYVLAREIFRSMRADGHHNDDAQLRRFLILVDNAAALPQPYARDLKFWSRYPGEPYTDESTPSLSSPVMSPAMGSRLTVHRRRDKGSSSASLFRGSVLSAQNAEGRQRSAARRGGYHNHLRTAIEEAQQCALSSSTSGTSSDDSSIHPSNPSTYRADTQPPKVFTDAGGSQWQRSSRMIGSGAFGDVWLGMSDEGSLVAFKCVKIPHRIAPSRAFLGMRQNNAAGEIASIINEVEMLSQYRHESIVSFIGCGVYEKFVIITMEYVSGGSLASVIEQFGTLPLATARRYTKEITGGLLYLHSNSIVHRDLKPANVLLHTDGYCKLSDFGTCVRLSSVSGKQTAEGTPLFMAPESSRGDFCKKSDLWSLGLTVVQMLNGQTPFEWDPEVRELTGVMFSRWLCREDGDVPLPSPFQIGDDAYSFVKKVLVRDPEGRPTTEQLMYDVFIM